MARKMKTAKKKIAKKKSRSSTVKYHKAKSKRGTSSSNIFWRPMQPSTVLATVVGKKAIPRTQVVKKVWAYIKKNNLQDPKERRNINADPTLQKVFGGKKTVNMFELTKLINKQLRDTDDTGPMRKPK